MSDGSSYTTNDFVIPEGGGSEIVVTGITLSKDSSNVNRFHVGINLSDSTMIDSGYITMVDNVSASFVDSKLTISVNGVSASGEFTAGTGITITSGTIAIDDTVVALKSDIADMETKTNASATYATKTALALTDSVANDANTKANDAINNVSIDGSTMTFTKINDEHIDVQIPSNVISLLEPISMESLDVTASSITISSTLYKQITNESNANKLSVCGSQIIVVYDTEAVTISGKVNSLTFGDNAKAFIANSVKSKLSLDDGVYILRFINGTIRTTNYNPGPNFDYYYSAVSQEGLMRIVISDNEITAYANLKTPVAFYGYDYVFITGLTKVM